MSIRRILVVTLAAIALSYVFWRPLWHGGGLVGGDTYSYYFPQKAFYADQLRAGRIPLWNPLVGHGYPTVGESQTGVFYPLNLLLYRLLPVNAAYNAFQLIHYVAAFGLTWLFARRLGAGVWGAGLCAVVFVYGWFAPRICLEWAIIGGVYLPLLCWCAESWLQSRRVRYLVLLALALGVHLLAGHFNLAFIEVLVVMAYSAGRLIWADSTGRTDLAGTGSRVERLRNWGAVLLAVMAGFGLAATQLAPTWELKQRSQRADVGGAHDPGYGHIPPWYLVQVATPWMWYAPDADTDEALASIRTLSYPAATNKVEAHLYFGLVPLVLVVAGFLRRKAAGERLPAPLRLWAWLGLAGAIYATGWLLPLTRHLPGFSFFIGPGRYGIVTTLAVGLLAGHTLDRMTMRAGRPWRSILIMSILGLTALDLWIVRCAWNRRVDGSPNWYADMVPDPPINYRGQSAVRKILSQYPQPVRMWASFQNMPTLTGFAMTPTYLGLSPAEYLDPQLMLPRPASERPTETEIASQVDWLQRAGVTHILAERPLDASWPVEPVWSGYDALLHRAWARQEPLYLYALRGSRGRASLAPPSERATVTAYSPHRVQIEVNAAKASELVLTDLAYPGWKVAIDGRPADWWVVDGMYRGVEVSAGPHRVDWTYAPASLRWGAVVSLGTLLLGSAVVWLVIRRAGRLSW